MTFTTRTLAVFALGAATQVAVVSCNGAEFSGSGGASDGDAGTAGKSSSGGSKATGGSAAHTGGKSGGGAAATAGTASGGQSNPGGAGDPDPGAAGEAGVVVPGFQVPAEGLLYWFSADVGVMAEGGTVTTWKNRAGNGYDAVQIAAGLRPKLEQTEVLPLPLVSFDGEDDYLELPELTASWLEGLSLFVVSRGGPATTCSALIELSNGEEINDINLASEGMAIRYEIDQAVLEADEGTFPADQVRLVEAHHGSGVTQSPVELRVNGGQAGSTVMQLPVDVPRISNFLGRSLYGSCVPFSGGIAELVMYSRKVSLDERLAIELYLLEKWQCCQ